MQTHKKLYKSRINKIIAGVAGGLAEYFNIDPLVVRFVFVVVTFFNGIGLIIYILMAWLLPYADEVKLDDNIIDITPNKDSFKKLFQGEDGRRNLLFIILIIIVIILLSNHY